MMESRRVGSSLAQDLRFSPDCGAELNRIGFTWTAVKHGARIRLAEGCEAVTVMALRSPSAPIFLEGRRLREPSASWHISV